MKIVINNCYGGFGLSKSAHELYSQLSGIHEFYGYELSRDDPFLVQTVETLGKDANGSHAELKVVEIPDDVQWMIKEYDGIEWIAEVHRTWS